MLLDGSGPDACSVSSWVVHVILSSAGKLSCTCGLAGGGGNGRKNSGGKLFDLGRNTGGQIGGESKPEPDCLLLEKLN